MLRLNSIFKLFEPESAQKNKAVRHLRIQTIYGGVPSSNLWREPPTDKSALARQKEILSKQSRYSSIEEVTLPKNTLLVGVMGNVPELAKFAIWFSIKIYYESKKWNGLEKYAASKNMGVACYQTKYDDVPCLKLIKPGDSEVCSYLIDSKALEINPGRGWLVSPPDKELVCAENTRNRLKK